MSGQAKRATVKDILPLGTWVITPNGAGEVTAASNSQATVTGLFSVNLRFGNAARTWDDTMTVHGLIEARSLRQATEAQAREVLDAERAKQAEALAEVERRRAEAEERQRQAAQRARILKEIGRRLEVLDADGLDRLERALSDIAPVLEAL